MLRTDHKLSRDTNTPVLEAARLLYRLLLLSLYNYKLKSPHVMILSSGSSSPARSSFPWSKALSCGVCRLLFLRILNEAHLGMARLTALTFSHVWLTETLRMCGYQLSASKPLLLNTLR